MLTNILYSFYGIYDKYLTIRDYISKYKNICIETIKSQNEIYEERRSYI